MTTDIAGKGAAQNTLYRCVAACRESLHKPKVLWNLFGMENILGASSYTADQEVSPNRTVPHHEHQQALSSPVCSWARGVSLERRSNASPSSLHEVLAISNMGKGNGNNCCFYMPYMRPPHKRRADLPPERYPPQGNDILNPPHKIP